MASEAFLSCTGLGWELLTPTRRCNCSINTNMRTVFGLFSPISSIAQVYRQSQRKHLRESEPSGRPTPHEETETFLLIGFGKDFLQAGFDSADGSGVLDAGFEDVGGGASGGCHGAGEQGSEEVGEDAVFEPEGRIREEVVLCGRVALGLLISMALLLPFSSQQLTWRFERCLRFR